MPCIGGWLCCNCSLGRPFILNLGYQIADVFPSLGYESLQGVRDRETAFDEAFRERTKGTAVKIEASGKVGF